MAVTGKVYVICHDGGVEGYSGPTQCAADLETAKKLAALSDSCMVIFEVPVWPVSDGVAWYSRKPVWP